MGMQSGVTLYSPMRVMVFFAVGMMMEARHGASIIPSIGCSS